MMTRLARLAVLLALTAAPALAADPVLGTWKTQPGDDGHFGLVTMAPCGSKRTSSWSSPLGRLGRRAT